MRQRGFSMIELMVGLTVGLLVALGAAALAVQFNQAQRDSVTGNSAVGNTLTALDILGHSLQQGGLGLMNQVSFGQAGLACATFQGVGPYMPVSISVDADSGVSDRITIQYGTNVSGAMGPALNSTTPVTDLSSVPLYNTSQFEALPSGSAQQAIVIDENSDCQLVNVTAVTSSTVSFSASGTSYTSDNPVTAVYPLGVFHNETWSVANNRLQVADAQKVEGASPVADNIVALKAQYGFVDTNGNFTSYGTTGALPTNTHAIRVALIVKPPNRQKGAAGACTTASGDVPSSQVPIDGWNLSVDVSGVPDWQCYTFRAIARTFLLRNLIWGTT